MDKMFIMQLPRARLSNSSHQLEETLTKPFVDGFAVVKKTKA